MEEGVQAAPLLSACAAVTPEPANIDPDPLAHAVETFLHQQAIRLSSKPFRVRVTFRRTHRSRDEAWARETVCVRGKRKHESVQEHQLGPLNFNPLAYRDSSMRIRFNRSAGAIPGVR